MRFAAVILAAVFLWAPLASAQSAPVSKDRQHLVFWEGSPQELEVYKIFGRQEGPTIMILGGIQGDEPGGFMSADLYADLALKRGNLIVVPRANFKSIITSDRGAAGDMNRKFKEPAENDPDLEIVGIIKDLMAESDVFLNLHDGSGFYRPVYESQEANPARYGQSIIADSATYDHSGGRRINLEQYAQEAVKRINKDIPEERYKFHFFNTKTADPQSRHVEQRKSATYYALTELGIPAYGIETSKSLPTLEMKIHQHNLAVNAFMGIFGVEIEQPRINMEPPVLSYIIIAVNGALPVAVAEEQTLLVAPGDQIEVIHVGSNYDRGISVDVQGLGGLNDIRRPLKIEKPTCVVVQKDHSKIGKVYVDFLPKDQYAKGPQLKGGAALRPPRAGTPVTLAEWKPEAKEPAKTPTEPSVISGRLEPAQTHDPAAEAEAAAKKTDAPGRVVAFLLEVDGRPVELLPGKQLEVLEGSRLKIVDFKTEGAIPAGTVMNLKGFVANPAKNDGEDRGATADTAKDMIPSFSISKKERIFELCAEISNNNSIAKSTIKIAPLKLASIELTINGQRKTLKLGGRIKAPVGASVIIKKVNLVGGKTLASPHFTLGGRPFPKTGELKLPMPSFAAALATWNGSALAGKVVLAPE